MENEVDFMIHGLVKFHLFGQELWITTSHVSILLIMLVLIGFSLLANYKIRHAKQVPDTLQNIIELIVESIDNLVHGILGKNKRIYCNYIGTIFIFILLSNISGLFGLRPPTADYGTTLALGLISFCMIQYNNVKYNKGRAFTELFKPIPVMFPINLISEIATPISLSLRLFGNVLSGTIMMALIYGLLPIFLKLGLPAVFHTYFDIFSGCIQTYVFCMLTLVFINQKIES